LSPQMKQLTPSGPTTMVSNNIGISSHGTVLVH
jgi:hypothetical protein